ncbi:hypothetical protein B296_00005197 [Ensete ventricosum]|uniref:Uncharacterized protein n=1 Tax=Ensete ventricosum TaxID=4639 RepID=A0A427A544_ENSVE|nr:hypothetical protein B296_00005197 [Ensete ventricosum]
MIGNLGLSCDDWLKVGGGDRLRKFDLRTRVAAKSLICKSYLIAIEAAIVIVTTRQIGRRLLRAGHCGKSTRAQELQRNDLSAKPAQKSLTRQLGSLHSSCPWPATACRPAGCSYLQKLDSPQLILASRQPATCATTSARGLHGR